MVLTYLNTINYRNFSLDLIIPIKINKFDDVVDDGTRFGVCDLVLHVWNFTQVWIPTHKLSFVDAMVTLFVDVDFLLFIVLHNYNLIVIV